MNRACKSIYPNLHEPRNCGASSIRPLKNNFVRIKKLFTLLTCAVLTVNSFAVNVTFNVDMTGQDVTNGVYIVGQLNAWAFTPLTDANADMIYTVTLDLAEGDYIFYYRNKDGDWTAEAREIIPAECADESLKKTGGWVGDRYINVVGTTPIVLNHKYSSCQGVITSIRDSKAENEIVIGPNPAKGQIKVFMNRADNAGTISIRSISGKVIVNKAVLKGQQSAEIDLSAFAKGIYFIEVTNGKKRTVQKLVVE